MDNSFASYRYRMLIPGQELERLGHKVEFNKFFRSAVKSNIFSKHFRMSEIDIALVCKDVGQQVIFDVCDNHLFDGAKHSDYYKAMIGVADTITCSTPQLADIIKDETGRAAISISDPFEYPEVEPRSIEKKDRYKLLWYGHETNINSLISNWNEINNHYIMVITSPSVSINLNKTQKLSIVPWSYQSTLDGFSSADMVIIPSINSVRKLVKSSNRMIEAIRQGKFVIANSIPSYEPFKDWMYLGSISDGLKWVSEHISEIPDRIRQAQIYVRENYSPEVIGKQWEKVLN